jgi:hypothetical protein
VVRADLLEESHEVVYRQPRLTLDTVPGGRDALLVGVIHFLVIIVVVGHGCNPLKASLLLLLAALGVLLGDLDDNDGWRHLAAARDRFLAAWDRERPDRLLTGDVLGGDVEQLLGGVPNDVIRCLKVRQLLRITHLALGCLWPQSLRTMTVSFLVALSTLAHVPCTTCRLCTHIRLVSLTARLGAR